MKRVFIWMLLLVLLVPLLAGCAAPPESDDSADDSDELSVEERLLGPHPLPEPDGPRMHAWLTDFVATYPLRVTGTPTEQQAGAFLASELETLGYDVAVLELSPGGLPLPDDPTNAFRAIVATLPGAERPDQWLAWGGHYDTVPSTIEGAYDNGSGIALSLELARMLKEVETNRTKAVILFNGEEEGMQASAAFMEHYANQDAYTIELFIGFDMVGIAHPVPGRPLAFFSGSAYGADFVPLAQDVAWNLLDLPADNTSVTFEGRNTRNSDEAQFASSGIATMRFAGLQRAGDYWGYHKVNDTMETIHAMTDGPENFQAGLANTAAFAYSMLVALDVRGVPQQPG